MEWLLNVLDVAPKAFGVSGSSSCTHRHEPVIYCLRCRSNDCNDQETAAPATKTSGSEKKKAAGWNGC